MDTPEIEAMLVVLAKRIEKLNRKVNGGMVSKSDEAWLRDLRNDAQKLNL